ncbi:LysR family transcriptional regulator [Amycolatopsis thailandensis]|uniref:LysR family transcriptional regulator n=1 Tax=Amycolatopsis thailandensis TaxID=589330 RepID=UPI00362D8BB1
MIRIPHLVTLRAVHRTRSFAVAARELGYTSSAVSQQIAALEKDTGLILFEREAHGIRATAAADRLIELSRPVLADMDELNGQVRKLASGTIGRIRFGCFPTGNVRLTPNILAGFATTRPGAEVTLDEEEPGALSKMLVSGELDVALLYEYSLRPHEWPDELTTHPVLREDLLLLRRSDSRLPPELRALRNESWITSAAGTAGAVSVTRLCASAGYEPVILFRSNNYAVVRELVAATGSVALVPALGHQDDERITASPVPGEAYRTVRIAYRARNSNPLLGDFLASIRDAVPHGYAHIDSAEDFGQGT